MPRTTDASASSTGRARQPGPVAARHRIVRGNSAIFASLVMHAAVAVVALRVVAPPVEPSAPAASSPEPPPGSLEPPLPSIDVVLLDGASLLDNGARRSPGTAASTAGALGADRGARRPAASGDAKIAGAHAGAGAGEPAERAPGSGRWLKMRGAGDHDLALDDAFVGDLLRDSRPLETVRRTGRVDPAGGGRSVIHDRVTTVMIDRHGNARFRDKADIDIHLDIPLPTPGDIIRDLKRTGREIAAWYEDPYKLARVGPSQDVPRHLSASPGACDRWDDACSTELREGARADEEPRSGGVAHGKLDITSWLMRRTVGDPYASRKLALLDSTRDERAAIGARSRAEDLARSAELMQRNLDALWRTTPDPVARRQALFTMWDECGEGEGPAGEAGERARRMVIGRIRARLPAGSPDAFTPEEIERLSARRSSRQAFAPYE
jgi:hypothetical protein